jgi:hypothetical protein
VAACHAFPADDTGSAPIDPLPAVAIPPLLAAWLAPFRDGFAATVWPRVLVLIAGAVLAPGQCTVSAALRVMGGGGQGFIGVADGMPP